MNLIWDITNKCNLNCKHCSNIDLMKNKDEIEMESWKHLIEYTSEFVDSVTLLGGEPLLHPEIKAILQELSERNIVINIITNGQFDSSTWDEIIKYDINSVQISIEGMKHSHDSIRGNGTWEKAIKSLNYLCKINNKVDIGVSIVVNKLNKDEIISFIESTKDLGIFYSINTLYIEGNAKKYEDVLSIKDDELINFYEEIAVYNSSNLNVKINFKTFPIITDYLNRKYGTNYEIREISCKALTSEVYSNPYGVLQPCRKYDNIKIHTNKIHTKWEDDYTLFKPFLEKIHNIQNNYCSECRYKAKCVICPFENQKEIPLICKNVIQKLKSVSIPLEAKFKIKKPYLIINSKEYSTVFFPNNHVIAEYEDIGARILEYINEFKTVQEIAREFSLDEKIVYEFLLQEKHSNKVIEKRN